jgi:hypothetical protein
MVVDFKYDTMVCNNHGSQKNAFGLFWSLPQPSLASPAASTCQFIMARTWPTFALLTDIKMATKAAVLSFCASMTRACRGTLIADTRFAIRDRGLANATLEELHPVCSCDHQVHVTIAIPIYEARHDTKRSKGNLNGQV